MHIYFGCTHTKSITPTPTFRILISQKSQFKLRHMLRSIFWLTNKVLNNITGKIWDIVKFAHPYFFKNTNKILNVEKIQN